GCNMSFSKNASCAAFALPFALAACVADATGDEPRSEVAQAAIPDTGSSAPAGDAGGAPAPPPAPPPGPPPPPPAAPPPPPRPPLGRQPLRAGRRAAPPLGLCAPVRLPRIHARLHGLPRVRARLRGLPRARLRPVPLRARFHGLLRLRTRLLRLRPGVCRLWR